MPRRTRRLLSARARGLRTLQHQSLPAATGYAIDTEVWFRGLALERARDRPRGGASGRDPRWATKDQVHDEAVAWFLRRHARRAVPAPTARSGPDSDVTFWLDSRLLERARRLATRNGLKLAQVIEQALTGYVTEHVPAALMAFRRRVQDQAARLHAAHARR